MREMVFTMGLPGAGKSTVVGRLFPDATVIDPDAIKLAYADYDPAHPELVHDRSTDDAERMFRSALNVGDGLWVVDGTGTNAEKMVRKMTEAKAAGYTVKLVYVVVSLGVSLARNAARTRKVPENVIREKALNIATSFELVAPYADSVTVVNNN